jgi:cysteine desulfurase/selenocysteine lyase
MRRIYLDNAATSWPKPQPVWDAVDRYQRECGAPAGRSAYAEAGEAEQVVREARRGVAQLLGVRDPHCVLLAFNGTDALNLALLGYLRPGDHVVTSVAEHNSVLRPLRALQQQRGIEVTYVPCGRDGILDPDDIRAALRRPTRLVALVHASNVTGAVQPLSDIGRVVREAGSRLLVDAAQSLGHIPVDVEQLHADLLAAPAHKGLLAPLGTGILYVAPDLHRDLLPLRYGGTGTRSEDDLQPDSLPDKYESGNHNLPGLAGLSAAAGWIRQRGVESLAQHERALVARLLEGLAQIDGVRLYGPRDLQARVGVVSFTVDGYDPQEVAALLDAQYRIQTRAGLHCAPRMHRHLETLTTGGTVRISVGPFVEPEDIDAAVQAVREIDQARLYA